MRIGCHLSFSLEAHIVLYIDIARLYISDLVRKLLGSVRRLLL